MFTVGVLLAAFLSAFISPEWAPTVNTALILALALFHAREERRRRELERKVQDAKRAAGAVRRDSPKKDTGERRRITD